MITAVTLLLLLAVIIFMLVAANVQSSVSLIGLGLMLLSLAFLLTRPLPF